MSTRREFLMQTAIASAAAATTATNAKAVAASSSGAGPSAMKALKIPNSKLTVSRLGYGCMQIGGGWDRGPLAPEAVDRAEKLIKTAYDNGITLFDHADIYCLGKSESAFGEVLKRSPGLRNKIIIQTKCGIRFSAEAGPPANDPKRYDNTYDYIVSAVEGSLKRLGTDHIDIYLLHRPDALVEPEEVAKAFDELQRSGKVRYFGVSNHTAGQIALLKRYVRQSIIVNQVRISLLHPYMFADGLETGLDEKERITHTYVGVAGVLDYCRLNDIQVQAYHPLQGGILNPRIDAEPKVKVTAELLKELAQQKGSSPAAIALAWVMRHPAGIVPLTGTTNPEHVVDNCGAERVSLTHGEWYGLFCAGAGISRTAL